MRRLPATGDPVVAFAARARSPCTTDRLDHSWQQWVAWCEANEQRPLLVASDVVVAFLHSQRRHWGADAMRNAADAIAQAHRALGLPDPTDGAVRRYLAAAGRAFAHLSRGGPITPIRGWVAADLCRAPSTAAPRQRRSAAHQTLALIAVRDHAATLAEVAGATARVEGAVASLLPAAGDTLRLDGPHRAAALAVAADVALVGTAPLPGAHRLQHAIERTAARAGVALGGFEAIPRMADDDFDWLLWWTDQAFATDVRNSALVLGGVALANRGIELGSFDIEDLQPADDHSGYHVMIRRSKTDPAGLGIDHFLGHAAHDEAGPTECPACHMSAWLYVLKRRWGITTGPLFPVMKLCLDRPAGRLATHDVTRITKAFWLHGGGDPDARISSRSLRRGGATSAHEAGMTVVDIAEQVTKHRCIDAVSHYIVTAVTPARLDV